MTLYWQLFSRATKICFIIGIPSAEIASSLAGIQFCFCPIPAVRPTLDIIPSCFSGTNRIYKLAFDTGYVGVEDTLGFGAEGYQDIYAEFRVIEARFLGVDVP